MFDRKRKTILLFVMVALTFALVITIHSRSNAASTPAEDTGKTDTTPPAAMSFSKNTDCASCHKAYVESMKNPKMLVNKHSAMIKDCFGCHKESDLKTAHAKVTALQKKFFRQRKYPNDMCLKCHGSYESLIEKTKDSKAFVTTQGIAINPHDTHVGHVECYNCHKMHKDKPPIEYCYGCHHPRQLNNCKDCHSPKKE